MPELAEVVGLEEQLTVPTRNRAHLVDLWIALEWKAGRAEWTKEFTMAARRYNALSSSVGALHLIPMTDRQGWIAARGVNLGEVSQGEVETVARRLVAQVNAVMSVPPADTHQRPRIDLLQRWRTSVLLFGSNALGFRLVPRRRGDADIASTG
jgi:hypothetical protein